MGQKHGDQPSMQESVVQQLDRQLVWSRRGNRCNHCRAYTATRAGHQDADSSQPNPHQPSTTSHSTPQGDPLDDSPHPNSPVRDIVTAERDTQLLADIRRAAAMAIPRCTLSRYAAAWAESLEGAINGHQSWADLCLYRCRLLLAEISQGSHRNENLNSGYSYGRQVKFTISLENSGTAASGTSQEQIENRAALTEEQREKKPVPLQPEDQLAEP